MPEPLVKIDSPAAESWHTGSHIVQSLTSWINPPCGLIRPQYGHPVQAGSTTRAVNPANLCSRLIMWPASFTGGSRNRFHLASAAGQRSPQPGYTSDTLWRKISGIRHCCWKQKRPPSAAAGTWDEAEVARFCAGLTRPCLLTASVIWISIGQRATQTTFTSGFVCFSLYLICRANLLTSDHLAPLLVKLYMFRELVFHTSRLQSSSTPLSSSCISAYRSCSISQMATADLVLPPVNYHWAFFTVSDVPPLPQMPS